ncbi:anaerobic sulfite reductase subunit AsrA [Clostridium botulinum]|uniref:anaerobic sulfite reductase subunit AsrA n=1 Tax=Clostridium botulinum TaxID=1491 RepID=UPI000774A354|nr:anaerobic sulfite reductase subunit AsrA [Clostridium botulinum]MBY6930429.1 anaerobic sulfite reductase subunit AsrA [Clostridium botulinum]NFG19392.1 anaerobic sulfite reductase subunit AsrA [Clostridium botulinum]NFL87878.1 anaerobic sulfite reductase subunit AsrA [Clostridium botulinum]NFO22532.1 anaerobic sulfite reductase subunit AsrA [Clostridium botulinum]NFO79503.1 anaerobic sulfite reductase subunit AsrA [Clostridium botulinum]
MGYRLEVNQFNDLLKLLESKYEIWAPKRFVGKSNFADTDYIRYDKVNNFADIEFKEKSNAPAKEVVFPITQTTIYFNEDNFSVPNNKEKDKLVIARACDINGIHRLDTLYYKNGEPDFYYKRLRDKIKFIILECPHSYRNCFCVSMGGNKTDDHVMGMKVDENNIFMEIEDEEFDSYFEEIGAKEEEYSFHYVEQNDIKVNVPHVKEIPKDVLTDERIWNSYDRCIKCGRCNLNCATCTCFTSSDLHYSENKNVGERRRVWTSCHFDNFSLMAGNHAFRYENRERGRYHVLHKVYDFKKKFGEGNMCVGCGRCEDTCPQYISYINTVNTLTKVLEEEYPEVVKEANN